MSNIKEDKSIKTLNEIHNNQNIIKNNIKEERLTYNTKCKTNGKKYSTTTINDRFIPKKNFDDEMKNYYMNSACQKQTNLNNLKPIKSNISENSKEIDKKSIILDQLFLFSAGLLSITKEDFNNQSKLPPNFLSFSKEPKDLNKKGNILNQMNTFFFGAKSSIEFKSSKRFIPRVPENVIDAPNLINDFFLNILDWGQNGQLAIALDKLVYLYNKDNNSSNILVDDDIIETVTSVKFLSSSNILSIGTVSGKLALFDFMKGMCIRKFQSHKNRVSCIDSSKYILSSSSKDKTIHNHDIRTKTFITSSFEYHKAEPCNIKNNNEGTYLASSGADKLVCIWDLRKCSKQYIGINSFNNVSDINVLCDRYNTPIKVFSESKAAVKALGWCPWKRNILATGGGLSDKNLRFYNCDTFKLFYSINTGSQICSLLWNNKEYEIISSHGYSQNTINIWNYPKLSKIVELKGHKNKVNYTALSPDSNYLASAGADETLNIWKIGDNNNTVKEEPEEEFGMSVEVH